MMFWVLLIMVSTRDEGPTDMVTYIFHYPIADRANFLTIHKSTTIDFVNFHIIKYSNGT
jgi:hypothetical protein